MLAEGIDSEEQLAAARAFGATLGQGYLLGTPAPLPEPLPAPGRAAAAAGRRRRPVRRRAVGAGDELAPPVHAARAGSRREAARVIVDHAAELG